MKHVFCVNNLISYLAALAVISREMILEEEYLIYSVNSKQYSPVKCIILNTKGGRIKQFFNRITARRKINKSVEKFTFKLYTSSMSLFAKCFATHPNCASINFIEEGLGCYVNEYPINFITDSGQPMYKLRNRSVYEKLIEIIYILIGESIKEAKIPFWYQAYIGFNNIKFYGFSDYTYYFAENQQKEILLFTDITTRFHFEYINQYNFDDSYILLGDAHLDIQNICLDDYINCIGDFFIPEIKRCNNKTIFIKFHPDETNESKNKTKIQLEENGVQFSIIPDNLSLEILLLKAKNVTLYGFDSSLLLYGAMMGHVCYSLSYRLKRSISCLYFMKMVKSI